MMAHCDKPVKRTQVNSVEECIQCYDGGGANQFSSWELVNQFSDSDKLQWDHQEQAYWVGPADEETAWSTACKWVQQQGGNWWAGLESRLIDRVAVVVEDPTKLGRGADTLRQQQQVQPVVADNLPQISLCSDAAVQTSDTMLCEEQTTVRGERRALNA